jgi:hypothetical protein
MRPEKDVGLLRVKLPWESAGNPKAMSRRPASKANYSRSIIVGVHILSSINLEIINSEEALTPLLQPDSHVDGDKNQESLKDNSRSVDVLASSQAKAELDGKLAGL